MEKALVRKTREPQLELISMQRLFGIKNVVKTGAVTKILGVGLTQIIKCLIFKDKVIMAIVTGDKEVDVRKLEEAANRKGLRLAKAKQVEK